MLLLPAFGQIDGAKHRQNLRLLTAVSDSSSASAFARYLPDVIEETDEVSFVPPTFNTSKGVVVTNAAQGRCLFVIGGMNGRDQVRELAKGYLARATDSPFGPQPFNDASYEYERVERSHARTTNVSSQCEIIGHSYGGATGMLLALRMVAIYSALGPGSVNVWTYGAPKCWTSRTNPWARQWIVRSFLELDPVPKIPPNFSEAPIWFTAATGISRGSAASWHQTVTGYEVKGGAMIPMVDTPAQLAFPVPTDVEEWLLSGLGFGSTDNHSLSAYVRAFAEVPGLATFQSQPQAQPIRGTTVPRVTQARARELTTQAYRQAGLTVSADPVQAAREIVARTPVVRGVRFTRRRQGTTNFVFYGQEVVGTTNSKREAKRLVRTLNASLRV